MFVQRTDRSVVFKIWVLRVWAVGLIGPTLSLSLTLSLSEFYVSDFEEQISEFLGFYLEFGPFHSLLLFDALKSLPCNAAMATATSNLRHNQQYPPSLSLSRTLTLCAEKLHHTPLLYSCVAVAMNRSHQRRKQSRPLHVSSDGQLSSTCQHIRFILFVLAPENTLCFFFFPIVDN